MWFFFASALLLMEMHCGQLLAQHSEMFFEYKIIESLHKLAANCTPYISPYFRLIMNERLEPPRYMNVPSEYLDACLRANLPKTNSSAPFQYWQTSSLAYNIAINEVVSLDFDGNLQTKANIISIVMYYCTVLCNRVQYNEI